MSAMHKALCMLGRHSGAWSQPGRHCETVRICESCGTAEEQTLHVWGPYGYTSTDRCEQVRACERCGAAETREMHVRGPWLYRNMEFNAPQERTCQRCRQTERTVYTLR